MGGKDTIGSLTKAWLVRKRYKALSLNGTNRDKVAKEILETEQIYVRNLEIIVHNYLKPLKNINPPLLSANSIQIIFGHVEDLLTVNRELLNSIQDRMATWYVKKQIGDSFLKLAPYLKLYTQYCSSYDKSISRLKRKCDDSKELTQFLKRITSETGFGLDLQSLLIMPIQRIPRYKLLLKSLIDHTPLESPDYPTIMEALEKVSQVANHINESIREKQNSEKILSIQRRFTGYVPALLAPLRTFIKEGYLTKICRKEPKKRWFILFSDALLYGTKIETVAMDPIYKFHRLLPLKSSKLNNLQDTKFKNSFQIIHTDKSFTVFADNEQEKASWIKEIENVLRFLGENEGSVARMNKQYSSMKILRPTETEEDTSNNSITAPVWIPDSEALDCMICTTKFNAIRRRHHCRRCGLVVCGKCSDYNWKLDNQKKDVRVCKACYTNLTTTGNATTTTKTILNSTTGSGSTNIENGKSSTSNNIVIVEQSNGISIDIDDTSSDDDTDNETSSIGDSHTEIPNMSLSSDPIEFPPPPPPIAIVATPTTPPIPTTPPPTTSTFTPPTLTKQGSQANSLLNFCNLIISSSPTVSPALERKNSQPKLSDLAKFNMPEHGKKSNNSSPISSPLAQRKGTQSSSDIPTTTSSSQPVTSTLSPLSNSAPTTINNINTNTTEEKVVLPEIKSILNTNSSSSSNLTIQAVTTPTTIPTSTPPPPPTTTKTKVQPNLPPTPLLPTTPIQLKPVIKQPPKQPPTTSKPTPVVIAVQPLPTPTPISPPTNNLPSLPLPPIPKKPLPPPPPPKQPSSVKLPPTPVAVTSNTHNINDKSEISEQISESKDFNQPNHIPIGNIAPPIPPKRKTMAPILPSQLPPSTPNRVLPPPPPKRN